MKFLPDSSDFVELILKDILSKKHTLLAIDASQKHSLFYNLIFNSPINETELQNIKQLEFSQALDRLVTLIKDGKIDEKFRFIAEEVPWLKVLNKLRNRITHRGLFVIRYKALDFLFGKFALPFLQKVISLPEYGKNKIWQSKPLHIHVDPIDAICIHFSSGKKYNINSVAILKELGRAAYQNPIHFQKKRDFLGIDKETKKRATVLAEHICKEEFCEDVELCPVCGVNSLVLFNDSFDTFDEHGQQDGMYNYVYKLTCYCCSFELKNEKGMNLKKSGIPITNYWRG